MTYSDVCPDCFATFTERHGYTPCLTVQTPIRADELLNSDRLYDLDGKVRVIDHITESNNVVFVRLFDGTILDYWRNAEVTILVPRTDLDIIPPEVSTLERGGWDY